MGPLSAGFVLGPVGDATTATMARLPLMWIPAFFVPLFLMMHATMLLQAHRACSRNASRSVQSGGAVGLGRPA